MLTKIDCNILNQLNITELPTKNICTPPTKLPAKLVSAYTNKSLDSKHVAQIFQIPTTITTTTYKVTLVLPRYKVL
jgi:hypothetical protein